MRTLRISHNYPNCYHHKVSPYIYIYLFIYLFIYIYIYLFIYIYIYNYRIYNIATSNITMVSHWGYPQNPQCFSLGFCWNPRRTASASTLNGTIWATGARRWAALVLLPGALREPGEPWDFKMDRWDFHPENSVGIWRNSAINFQKKYGISQTSSMGV